MPVKYEIGPLSDFANAIMSYYNDSVLDGDPPALDTTTGYKTCDSQCYTAGTNTSNGVLTINTLDLTWEQKCKWTTPYCGGCLECSTPSPSPPVAPPNYPPGVVPAEFACPMGWVSLQWADCPGYGDLPGGKASPVNSIDDCATKCTVGLPPSPTASTNKHVDRSVRH